MEETGTEFQQVNLEDFMDVVTAYKCKFCAFTCSTPQEMTEHIKQDHILTKNGGDIESKQKKTDNLATTVDCSNMTAGPEEQLTIITDDGNSLLAVATSTGQSISVPENPVQIQTINLNSTHDSTTTSTSPDMAIEAGEQYTLTNPNDMDNSQLNTKLLYVCGQCSVGFNSFDDCKEHMLASHNLTDNNMEMETLGNGSSQISVGTQMEPKKKPGRKKKTAVKEEVITSEESEEENDKDWLPSDRPVRSRRKIRTPKALREDYYIGKKKKSTKRKRMTTNKEFIHKCHLYGCMAKFKQKQNLDIHIKCHNTHNEAFTCPECNSNFDAWKVLRLHLYRQHSIDLDLFSCDICNVKTDTLNKLKIHKEIHSDSRPYTCDICGKGFRQYCQMKNHQTIHVEHQKKEQTVPVTCRICQRSFVNKKCLLKHESTVHSGDKQFKCTVCSYASTRKAMLTLHMRMHTGDKPFKCDLCTYSTGDHNSLRRHKMRHTGQKQYKCSYCPYACIQSISLKCHLKTKHPGCESSYTCIECGFRTINKTSYENHMLDHKNGLVTIKPRNKTKPSIITQTNLQVTEAESGINQYVDNNRASMQVRMQVQTMKSGEAQVSAEDLAKLTCYEGLMTGEASAAQLIYSALNAISQNEKTGVPQTAELSGGVQCTTVSADCEEGVTSHTIVFHLPSTFQTAVQQTVEQNTGESVLFGHPIEIVEAINENQVEYINESTGEAMEAQNIVTMGIVVDNNLEEGNCTLASNPSECVEIDPDRVSFIINENGSQPSQESSVCDDKDNRTDSLVTIDLQQIAQVQE